MQAATPAPPQLQDLAIAYRTRGSRALGHLLHCAVLVHCSGHTTGPATSFETVVAFAPWGTQVSHAAARSAGAINPELLLRAGAVFPVEKRPGGPFPDRIGVGRARTADVSLRLASVSKYHAYFSDEGNSGEQLTLWEARARNGTYVGGRRLDEGEGVALATGTLVAFGGEEFLFFTSSGFRQLLDHLADDALG